MDMKQMITEFLRDNRSELGFDIFRTPQEIAKALFWLGVLFDLNDEQGRVVMGDYRSILLDMYAPTEV